MHTERISSMFVARLVPILIQRAITPSMMKGRLSCKTGESLERHTIFQTIHATYPPLSFNPDRDRGTRTLTELITPPSGALGR